eukprot:TRINITY_DN22772_c0_g1_i1.p1 TRINITY_DN22772_c0_g1~~TRINITY_DN22772_c0_g1_i1.p1  ORF type:complete len:158 (-),score=36.20 TRINITY_DN22772_c0_g1_i1:480-953(-)
MSMPRIDPDLVVRDLAMQDYDKGYLKVLSYIANVAQMSHDTFEQRFAELDSDPNHQFVVIEQASTGTIVAAGTLYCERKFIHNCGLAGHIEDISVDSGFKRKRLGSRMVFELLRRARERGCYKVELRCTRDNVPFYEHCGFRQKDYEMVYTFPAPKL